MPSFGRSSKARLDTCDPRLQKVFNEVIKHWDCTVIQGHRSQEEQDEYYRTGKSKVKFPNSKHNSNPSKAVDVAPYHSSKPHIRWNSKEDFYHFAGFVLGIATSMGIKLRYGGDWNSNRDVDDQQFLDLPHFEIVD